MLFPVTDGLYRVLRMKTSKIKNKLRKVHALSMATCYGRSEDWIPAGTRFSASVQTGLGAHPASQTMVPSLFSGRKAVEVKERVELYLYSCSGPSLPVLGRLPSQLHERITSMSIDTRVNENADCARLISQCFLLPRGQRLILLLTHADSCDCYHVPSLEPGSLISVVEEIRRCAFVPQKVQGGSNMTGRKCDLFTHK